MFRKLIATSPNWVTIPIRLALGAVMIGHGAQKVLGSFGGPGFEKFVSGNTPFAFMKPTWFWLGAAAVSEWHVRYRDLVGDLESAGVGGAR